LFSLTLLGSFMWLIDMVRIAEENAANNGATVAFAKWHYWIVLFSAPVSAWFAFRRVHHGSLPWWCLSIALLTFWIMGIQTYTGDATGISTQRNQCTDTDYISSNPLKRKQCDITYLGFSGTVFIFVGQMIGVFVSTVNEHRSPPSWVDVLALCRGYRDAVAGRTEAPSGGDNMDLVLRFVQLVFNWCGWLFWLIELGYWSNNLHTITGAGTAPDFGFGLTPYAFSNWFFWITLWVAPALIGLSLMSNPPRLLPFASVIVAFMVFWQLFILTPNVVACNAYFNDDNGHTKLLDTNCNFHYTAFAGCIIVWFCYVFFIAIAASDVYGATADESTRSAPASDTKGVLMARVVALIFVILGCFLWIILLCQTAVWISWINNQGDNPLGCTSDSLVNCYFWYEWYWWQLVPFTIVVGVIAFLRTPRAAIPFYCSLLLCILFFATYQYTNVQRNIPAGSISVPGIQVCRSTFYDKNNIPGATGFSSQNRFVTYCQVQAVGFSGLLMMIVAFCILLYTSGGRLAPDKTRLP